MRSSSQADTLTEGPTPRFANVLFVVGSLTESGFGMTSPEPNPTWETVARQLARRLPNFASDKDGNGELIKTEVLVLSETTDLAEQLNGIDVVVGLGVVSKAAEDMLAQALSMTTAQGQTQPLRAFLADPSCSATIQHLRFAGDYYEDSTLHHLPSIDQWQQAINLKLPWSSASSGRRLLVKTDTLFGRKSSEDYLFAILFVVHALVRPLQVVASDINPSWEKGLVRNFKEFSNMCTKCGPTIAAAISDPPTKAAIDLLNACDLRDQVGSYRVIVSNETPQLEEFTLCVLQRGDCFASDAPILQKPRVPLLETWRGKPLDAEAAEAILVGHLNWKSAPDLDAGSHSSSFGEEDWSWKIVVGANPAYDAFPMQHQIFYPSGAGKQGRKSGGALWYDPVFCVETLQGELVWCKRHYRCVPRKHWSGRTAGAWTLTTLDNGMVSEEHWTTVDAADDLSWVVLHYSGAARRAGQSYVGALLCTKDGSWPTGTDLDRIRQAFLHCDLQLWELFGGSTKESYMWSRSFLEWRKENPPPLELIGDKSITAWRRQEREKYRNISPSTN